jgi:outer membrane protein W
VKRLLNLCPFAFAWLFAAPSAAQMDHDGAILTVNVGWTIAKNEITTDYADGGSLNVMLDKPAVHNRGTFGINVVMLQQHDNFESMGLTLRSNTWALPVYLTGKFWVGKSGSRVKGYAGLGIGVYFGEAEIAETGSTSSDPIYRKDRTSGAAFSIPVGITVRISEGMFINANYLFNALGDSFYDNNVAHMIAVGLGFTTGGS